jgi:type IV pilus assembly protein PilM
MSDPIWKKEINFRKKPAPPATAQPPAVVQPGERPASIWKRELRFRKPFELSPSPEPGVTKEQPPAESVSEEPPGRFGPAPAWDSPAPSAPFVVAPAVEDSHVPTADARAEHDVHRVDEPVSTPEPPIEHWTHTASPAEPVAASPPEPVDSAFAATPVSPVLPEPVTRDEVDPQPSSAEPYGWRPEPTVEHPPTASGFAVVPVSPALPEPEPAHELVAEVSEVDPQPTPVEPHGWAPEPVDSPPVLPEPEPVHEPVAEVSEVDPQPAPAEAYGWTPEPVDSPPSVDAPAVEHPPTASGFSVMAVSPAPPDPDPVHEPVAEVTEVDPDPASPEPFAWTPEPPAQQEWSQAQHTPEEELAAEHAPEPEPEPEPEPAVEAEALQPDPVPPTTWIPVSALDEPVQEPAPTLEPQLDPEPAAAAAVVAAAPAAPKASKLKREVKLPKRKRRAAKAAVTAAAVQTVSSPEPVVQEAPAAPKESLLKRDLKLSKGRGGKSASSGGAPKKAQKLVGLRIGSSQLAAAYVYNDPSVQLEQLARSPIPRGIVSSGEVRDPEALTHELKKFFAQHKLPRKGVRLGIASNRIGVRVVDVPKVDDPKLFENSIRFHAQETLPIAVSDAILDHVVVGETPANGHEATVRLLLVFAHRELVERHVDACRRAGLKLAGVDFEPFALLRALRAPRPADEEATEAVVAVAIGHDRTIFAVSDGRTCDFTRVLEWGGGVLDVAIARALNLTPSQAEPIKQSLGLDGPPESSQLDAAQVESVRVAIRTEIQGLARELVSSLQFYQSRADSLDIGSILLSGGGSELLGFAAELERHVGVPVRLGDPLVRIELGRKVHRPAEPGSLAIAIGLGIED